MVGLGVVIKLSVATYRYRDACNTYRKAEVERRAAISIICGPQFPSMPGNDAMADRKSEPHSLGFRAEERLEDLFHFFRRNAATSVGDRYNHCAAPVLGSSANKQATLGSAAINHCVTSIDHQIKQDLLKLHRVANDGGQTPGELTIHGDLLIYEIATKQFQDILHNVVDPERMLFHFAFFQPQTQAANDFASTFVLAYDFIENFSQFGVVDL